MNWFKLGAYVVALVLIGFGVRWCVTTIHKANERDAAVAELGKVRAQSEANLKAIANDIAESERDRKNFDVALAAIDKRFDDIHIPPPATLIQSKGVPGEPCRPSTLGPEFYRVFNASGAAAGPAEDKAH